VTPHAPATETRFGDGSTATALTQGAVLELRTTSDTELVVVAKSGSFRFDVVPNPARQFVVEAGDVTVRVLGTRFVVTRQDARAEVRVERGRVEVTWPNGRTELSVDGSGWFPPLPEPASSAAEPVSSAARGPLAVNERTQFIELTRKGDYQAAYAIIDRAPQLFVGCAEDLMMAADAARLSNHPRQAVGYLQRITKEHPSDSRAPLAAFTLGRIFMSQLGQPAAAARAFAQVRQLAPAGALVEDALAREAEALEQAGQHQAAQRLVEAYLKQYPTGRRSERLRQLVNH
jgi:transmembrane sensor